MIERWVFLYCEADNCGSVFRFRTHDATIARRHSREEGWVVSRIGHAGLFTDWCPQHKAGVGLTSRYRTRKDQ